MKPVPTEDQLQIFAADVLEAYGRPDVFWHHSPNGGWRHPATANRMKRYGTKAGFPDLMFMRPFGAPAYLELKTIKGHLSPAQKEFRDYCLKHGYEYKVARSTDEIIDVLNEYGVIQNRPARSPSNNGLKSS